MNTEPTSLVGAHAPDWGQRSRLSKTNRADSPNGRSQRSIPESRKRPLTDRDGITLRTEVRDLSNFNADRAISWDLATDRWRNYILDKEEVETVLRTAPVSASGARSHIGSIQSTQTSSMRSSKTSNAVYRKPTENGYTRPC